MAGLLVVALFQLTLALGRVVRPGCSQGLGWIVITGEGVSKTYGVGGHRYRQIPDPGVHVGVLLTSRDITGGEEESPMQLSYQQGVVHT